MFILYNRVIMRARLQNTLKLRLFSSYLKREIKNVPLIRCNKNSFYYKYILFDIIRSLVSPSILRINEFIKNNSYVRLKINDIEDFVERSSSRIESEEALINSEDVKKIIAICEKQSHHLNLTIEVIKKYYFNCEALGVKPDHFGPILARLLYTLREPEIALKIIKTNEISKYLRQYSTFLVTMDLLFECKRYTDVIYLMDEIQAQNLLRYPRHCLTIACAACYKLNTDEILDHCCRWIRVIDNDGDKPTLRSLIFISALALNKKKFDLSKSYISKIGKNSLLINNIFFLCSCHLGQLEDVLDFWRLSLHMHKVGKSQPILSFDIIDTMEELFKQSGDSRLKEDFEKLNKLLQKYKLISPEPFETLLFEPIEDFKAERHREDRSKLHNIIHAIEELD